MAKNLVVLHADGTKTTIESRSKVAWIQSGTQSVENQNEDIVDISVVSIDPIPFEIGDKIVVYGRPYWLNQVPKVQRSSSFKYVYSLKFEGLQYQFARATYDVNVDTTGSDLQNESLTADLLRFMQIWKINVERVVPGLFELGTIPEGTEIMTLTFGDADNCLAVLQTLCQKYGVEFDIRPNADGSKFLVNIGTNGKTFVKAFRYGRGGGIYDLSREVVDDANIVNRLKVYGSSKNLGAKYRATRLLLPGKAKKDSFLEDQESIEKFGVWENAKTFEDFYPHRTGHVSATTSSILEFIDSDMDFDLNEKDEEGNTKWLIAGVAAKIHFNTGKLAGYDFDLTSYNHETKTFKIQAFEDSSGYAFPSESSTAFRIQDGDEYMITDIVLPDSYIETAENGLKDAAEEYLSENKDPKVKYSLQISEMYLENLVGSSESVQGEIFWIGDLIPIIDEKINVNRTIRVTGFKRNILRPYQYQLTIADGSYNMTITQRVISELTEHDKIIKFNDITDPMKARRNWRNVQEVLGMIFDADGYFDGGKIRPESIETQMLAVGGKSMQFLLNGTSIQPNYAGDCNRVEIVGGSLVHYAIQEDGVRTWNLQNASYTIENDKKTTAFYIYARCERSGNAGTIILDETARKVDSDPSYYYFLIGVLNSADGTGSDAVRSIYLMYGFTTINGKWIKTGCIQSTDGNNWFDLDGNSFRLGDDNSEVSWNKNGNGKIILKGTIVQSQSGDENVIGCYRGEYNENYIYYYGDEVTYTADSTTSTYRMIKTGQCKGVVPTNTAYWKVIAAGHIGKDGKDGKDGQNGQDGSNGTNGDTTIFRYKNSSTKPDTPQAGSIPSDWTADPSDPGDDEFTWLTQATQYGSNGSIGSWTDPVRITGTNGKPGEDGVDGKNGTGVEFIYKLTKTNERPNTPATAQTDDYVPSGWTDNPTGVDATNQYEWVCTRQKTGGTGGSGGTWSAFTTPVIWSKWGEKGQDGDGYEYIYKRTANASTPSQPTEPTDKTADDYVPSGWTDNPTGVDDSMMYEWVCMRKKRSGVWGSFGSPALWAKYAKDGAPGESVVYADLSNEIEGVVLSGEGKTLQEFTIETNVHLWFGSNDLTLTRISVEGLPTGVTSVESTTEKKVTLTIPTDTAIPSMTEVRITPYGQLDDEVYHQPVIFTLIGVQGGKDGVMYYIIPSVNSVVKDKDGNYSVSAVSCAKYKRVGNAAAAITTDGSLQYSIDGGTFKAYSSAIATSAFTKTLTFQLKVDNIVVDRETIPLIKDGQDGQNGSDGSDGQDGTNGSFTEYRFAVNGSTSTPPTLNKTTRNPSGWSTSQPAIGKLQYLWQTKATINGDGTLSGSWSTPIRITPYDGQDGVDGTDGKDGQDGTNGSNAFSVGCKVTCHNGSDGQVSLEEFYVNGSKVTTTPKLTTINNGSSTITNNVPITLSRGHNALVINSDDMSVVEMYKTDDYSTPITSQYLAIDLSSLDPKMIVVMIGADACSCNAQMRTYLSGMGGLQTGTFEQARRRHYFIGQPGLDFGMGYEEISEDTTAKTIMVNVVKGKGIVTNGKKGDTGATGAQGRPGAAGPQGRPGAQGDRGPSVVFRGDYKSSETYYGMTNRVDVVKYSGAYYVARTDVNSFTNILPTNTSYWNTFGATFESVATTLLLAELANIGGWIFKDNMLISQVGMLKGSSVYYSKRTKTSGTWGSWSTPAVFDGSYWNYVDTDTTEYIFKVSIGVPSTPTTSTQTAGYVPEGWFADAKSVLSEDYSNANFVPAVSLDALTGEIRLGSSLCIDREMLQMFDNNGATKLKVYNGSVGTYNDAFLKASDSVGETKTETIRLYYPTTSTSWKGTLDGGVVLDLRLGYFEKGSILTIGSIQYDINVPYYNDGSTIYMYCNNYPALKLRLLCNDKVIGEWNSGSQGLGPHASGTKFTLNVTCGITKTIDEYSEGMYRIQILDDITYQGMGKSGVSKSFRKDLTYSYSYQKAGIEKTILGTDGLVSAWNTGYMFMSAAAFAVRFGSYMLKIDTTGIKKSSDGGVSWNTI